MSPQGLITHPENAGMQWLDTRFHAVSQGKQALAVQISLISQFLDDAVEPALAPLR